MSKHRIKGHAWRKLQARVYRTETHCGLCGGWVDQNLPWMSETGAVNLMSRSVDHKISVHERPDLALVRSNCQLAHIKCNRDKGDGEVKQVRTPTSHDW